MLRILRVLRQAELFLNGGGLCTDKGNFEKMEFKFYDVAPYICTRLQGSTHSSPKVFYNVSIQVFEQT